MTGQLPAVWNYWHYDQLANAERTIDDKARYHTADKDADYGKWCDASFWTADQATALSYGKAPEKITYKDVQCWIGSEFAYYYVMLKELIEAGQKSAELPERIRPSLYIDWAKANDISLPDDLIEAVQKAQRDMATLREKNADLERTVRELQRRESDLRTRIAGLNAVTDTDRKRSSDEARERNTLLKIVVGLAIQKFHFRPDARKQHASTAIAGALAQAGIRIDDATVRKYLKEGYGLLSVSKANSE